MSLDVESILHSIGVTVLKERGDELIAKCPMHLARTGSEDGRPSWSINSETYVHHCFSCGYSGTLNMLYQDLMGEIPEDLEWQLSKQSVISSLDRPSVDKSAGPKINEWALSQFSDIPEPLLLRRNLMRKSIDFFGVRWDKQNKAWVIPIRTVDGKLLGFQFRQRGSVINHPPGLEKASTLFGINLFLGQSRITLVESPLDAVRFFNIGVPAVSSFGASVSARQIELLSRNYRNVIVAMDNDSAGKNALEFLRGQLSRRGSSVLPFDYSQLEAKDPGDVETDTALLAAWERSASLNLIDR